MAVTDEKTEKALKAMCVKDSEEVRDFLKNLDSIEVEEKNGHKLLHAQSGETEYFCIQAKDKLIMAVRDDETFSYFAQTKDGKLMEINGEDYSLSDNGKTLSVKVDGEEEKIVVDVQKRDDGTIEKSALDVISNEDGENVTVLSVRTKYDKEGKAVSVESKDRIFMEDDDERLIKLQLEKDGSIKDMKVKGIDSEDNIVDVTIKDGKIVDGIVISDTGVWHYQDGKKEFLGANLGLVNDIEEKYVVTQENYKETLKKEFEGGYVLSEVADENGYVNYYRSDNSHPELYKISKDEYESGLTNNFIASLNEANYSRDEYRKMQQGEVMEIAGYKVAYTPVSQMDSKEVQNIIDGEKEVIYERDSNQLKNDLREQAEKGGELPSNPKSRSQEIRFDQHYIAKDNQKAETERTDNSAEEKKNTNVMAMNGKMSEGR